ncbi:aarF domain-containing protein kinase 1-like [Gadus macrocephalus]|uniref:aarF domain-containing protein kinase 1-like n=1 Tax=Gadus macrocephalus TaxID=80720 RepID=UPI0028CB34BB|nr:aarF domain-containing protein kinase 1-like [Gadus macrocephalus]
MWSHPCTVCSPGPLNGQDVEIRTNVSQYLPQISELLNRVPRQMLLLLKTNDLLRGIEAALQTRAASSSFLNMSRCCVRALARHRRSKASSRTRRLRISVGEVLGLWRLGLYEVYLQVKGHPMARWLWALLGCLG